MFTNVQDLHAYATAGRATLTLTSEETGTRYTFRISAAKDCETRWFVSLLTGPDNTSDYSYLGMIDGTEFRTTKASKFAADSKPVRGFAFFWRHVAAQLFPPQMQIRHEGRCGRCGRVLTVPESIDSGLGPECRSKMES
jgi:Family of unknown function (DUF6011)